MAIVPTMGFLHEGHLSLVRIAKKKADKVVVSIFVNPTQFGPNEDFASYPRDEKRDFALLRAEGVDAVFAPEPAEMYCADATVSVAESSLSKVMCGASRPIHFGGVMTVCLKLFNLSRADFAVFGRKDAQQLAIIRRMVRDLDVPVKIIGAPLVREKDGLAKSSRNTYLSPDERTRALALSAALAEVRKSAAAGRTNAAQALAKLVKTLSSAPGVALEYAVAVDADTLAPVDKLARNTLVAVAARVGKTRLIDNVLL